MNDHLIDHSVLADRSWWHWTATVPFLILYLNDVTWAIYVAAGLCVAAAAYFFRHVRAFKPYPVQIRIAYLAWLLTGMLPGMGWMHWIQLAGTTAMVTVGYCPLARLLSLLPLNRTEPLSWSLVVRVFLRDPCAGGLVRWSIEEESTQVCCSLRTPGVGASCSPSQHSFVEENQRAAAH